MDIVKNPSSQRWPKWLPPKLRRVRFLIALGVAALGILAVGVWGLGNASPAVQRDSLWIGAVERGDMKREIRAAGTLVPKDTRWVVAGAVGSVERILIEPGAKITKDTVILTLRSPQTQTSFAQARAALSGVESEVAATQASMESQLLDQKAAWLSAESDWKLSAIQAAAYKRAYEGGAISRIELSKMEIAEQQARQKTDVEAQRILAAKENMRAQLQMVMTRREQAASALDMLQQQIDSLQVTSEIEGVLQQIDVEPGQQVEMGAKLARIAKPEALIARIQVPEVLAKDLALELPATVDLRVVRVEGKVVRIDPAVRDGSVSVDIDIASSLPPAARPDLTIEGRVLLGTRMDVLSIPKPSMAVPNSAATLFVIRQGDSVARRTKVEFGLASSDRIEVRSGLKPNDQVILSDTSRWKDSTLLRIN